jgi:hypothetical protein
MIRGGLLFQIPFLHNSSGFFKFNSAEKFIKLSLVVALLTLEANLRKGQKPNRLDLLG